MSWARGGWRCCRGCRRTSRGRARRSTTSCTWRWRTRSRRARWRSPSKRLPRFGDDDLVAAAPHMVESKPIVALDAARPVRRGDPLGERTRGDRGRTPAGRRRGGSRRCMYSLVLCHALRGDDAAAADWRSFAGVELAGDQTRNIHFQVGGMTTFVEARLALHFGRWDEAAQLLAHLPTGKNAWWQVRHWYFDAYPWAVAAELAVAAGLPDAAARLAAAEPAAQENRWAAACVARARGRLTGRSGRPRRGGDGLGASRRPLRARLHTGADPVPPSTRPAPSPTTSAFPCRLIHNQPRESDSGRSRRGRGPSGRHGRDRPPDRYEGSSCNPLTGAAGVRSRNRPVDHERRLLDRRVRASQARRHREVHQRVERAGHHQRGGPVASNRGRERDLPQLDGCRRRRSNSSRIGDSENRTTRRYRQQVPVDARDPAAPGRNRQRDPISPHQTADDLPAGEDRVRTARDPGERVEHGADQRYEDRASTIALPGRTG